MKRFLQLLCLCLTLFMVTSTTSYAFPAPGGGDPVASPQPGGDGGEVPDGPGEGPPPEPVIPREPVQVFYSPVVTSLHSVNAAFANKDNVAVYFMPRAEDFPVDLEDMCSNVTDVRGQQHQFAIVYDGDFNKEVELVDAVNASGDSAKNTHLMTSKKVYSQTDNSRALQIVGYDLLLSRENARIASAGGDVVFTYEPTLVGTAPITTMTAVMDLYKAVGQYEWDIKLAWSPDESLTVSTSPIMQQLMVDTHDKDHDDGIDVEEGCTWVWATRTNPDLYWARAKKDAIFDGGAHKYTKPVYIGNEVSVSFSKNELQNITMAEFCQLARAIMTLYGEPVLTEREIEAMIQSYALDIPTDQMNEEALEAVRYLAAKGIIEPSECQWEKQVTFADIEPILLRIADEQSRLTVKNNAIPDSAMARAGYVKAQLGTPNPSYDDIEEIANPFDTNYYDYFVEAVDGYTNFYLRKIDGVDLSNQENMEGDPGHEKPEFGSDAPYNDKLTVIGDSISAYSGYDSGSSYYPSGDVYDVSQMWYSIVAQRNGYTLSTIASRAGCLTERDDGGTSGVEQAQSWIDTSAGTTAVFVGTNDVVSKTPVDEFEASYKKLLSIVRERNQETKIVCFTPYQSGAEPYNEAILRACQQFSASIVKLPTPDTVDNTHPTSDGMRTIASAAQACFGPAPTTQSPSSGTGNGEIAEITPNPIVQDGKEYAFACDKLVVAGASNVATTSGSGFFEYMGLYEYEGRQYYHFRISRDIGSVTVKYDADPNLEELKDIKEYTLANAQGGMYNYSPELVPYMTLDEALFNDEFIDAERVQNDPYNLKETEAVLSEYHWYRMEYTEEQWNSMLNSTNPQVIFQAKSGTGTTVKLTANDFQQSMGSGGNFVDELGNRWFVIPYTSTIDNVPRVNLFCQTKMDRDKFIVGTSNVIPKQSTSAYYKCEDGTVLASYNYLKEIGVCGNIQMLPNGTGVMLSTSAGNVSLRPDLDLVIVGDTCIPANGEMLYYTEGNQYYINLKACLGWSNDYVVVSLDDTLVPLIKDKSGAGRSVSLKTSTQAMRSFYPSSSVTLGRYSLGLNSMSNVQGGQGFAMTMSNPLGNYMVVMDWNSDTDYVYVWHRKDATDASGNTHEYEDARGSFASKTGVNVSGVSSDYALVEFQLNRNNVGNPAGFKFLMYTYGGSYKSGDAVYGYVYEPPTFGSFDEAANAYMEGSTSCPLPIARIGSTYVNLNMNTCSDVEGNTQMPMGQLPMFLHTNNKDVQNKMGKIEGSSLTVKETAATYDTLENVKIYTAPVGLFQVIKGLDTRALSDWTGGAGGVYFGSSKCVLKNGKILISNHPIEFDTGVDAICTLYTKANNSVYVINKDASALGAEIEETVKDFAVTVSEPETLIDWDRYKFARLVENLDSWTTILLIFVLNILPRVCMWLFFLIMLFSLIKNVKPWRTFCNEHFDVYAFLTRGHITVDTVDMKKVMFISLICFSLFLIIMDGQLFNFVIFICRFFIALTQR